LCTRAQAPTKQDNGKLRQLLGYPLRTKERVLILKPSQSFNMVAYIDASFVIHAVGKLHTGVVIFVGRVAAFLCFTKTRMCEQESNRSRAGSTIQQFSICGIISEIFGVCYKL
jgi:hypothetical protein